MFCENMLAMLAKPDQSASRSQFFCSPDIAGRDDDPQLPGHHALLSPGHPHVGHTPPSPPRGQCMSV